MKEKSQKWYQENKERASQRGKENYLKNKEAISLKSKEKYEKNKEKVLLKVKQYRESHQEYYKEYRKEYRKNNKEKISERDRKYRERIKEENIQRITEMLEIINPLFAELNLSTYGTIYKITNIKTGRCYIGQTIVPLIQRYSSNVIRTWLNERNEKSTQKFKDELINEDDFEVIEVLNIGCCRYHLNQLEAYYIDYYKSYEEGYNNNSGPYDDDSGIEEFEDILKEHGLEFIGNELRRR
jgi:hypothetical protein